MAWALSTKKDIQWNIIISNWMASFCKKTKNKKREEYT